MYCLNEFFEMKLFKITFIFIFRFQPANVVDGEVGVKIIWCLQVAQNLIVVILYVSKS